MTSPIIFDRKAIQRRIARVRKNFVNHKILFEDSATQIRDRIAEVSRDFTKKLDLASFPLTISEGDAVTASLLAEDGEFLPFEPNSFDLVASTLELHWINDVPGVLTQIRALLNPEGMFIASLIGDQSLRELRECLIEAELAVTGGISPRLSPTIDLQTASGLMQRAGFTLPVADKETITFIYKDMFTLMRDLRGMGQTNAHIQRLRHATRRAIFFEAARIYQNRFADKAGHIPATFEIIYLHGWK